MTTNEQALSRDLKCLTFGPAEREITIIAGIGHNMQAARPSCAAVADSDDSRGRIGDQRQASPPARLPDLRICDMPPEISAAQSPSIRLLRCYLLFALMVEEGRKVNERKYLMLSFQRSNEPLHLYEPLFLRTPNTCVNSIARNDGIHFQVSEELSLSLQRSVTYKRKIVSPTSCTRRWLAITSGLS